MQRPNVTARGAVRGQAVDGTGEERLQLKEMADDRKPLRRNASHLSSAVAERHHENERTTAN